MLTLAELWTLSISDIQKYIFNDQKCQVFYMDSETGKSSIQLFLYMLKIFQQKDENLYILYLCILYFYAVKGVGFSDFNGEFSLILELPVGHCL